MQERTGQNRATVCYTSSPRRFARRWFRQPITDRPTLIARQSAIGYFVQDCNMPLAVNVQRAIKHVKRMHPVMQRMRSSQMSVGDWHALHEVLDRARSACPPM